MCFRLCATSMCVYISVQFQDQLMAAVLCIPVLNNKLMLLLLLAVTNPLLPLCAVCEGGAVFAASRLACVCSVRGHTTRGV